MNYISPLAYFKIKSLLIIWFSLCVQATLAQTLFQSIQEIGTKNILPSDSLKQKVANITKKPIGTEKEEFGGIYDRDFYQLKNGFISYGPEVNYMHYRLIFDQQENWIETQELFHSDVLPEDEYYQIIARMRTASKKKYFIAEAENYLKISNSKGHWYEIMATILPQKTKQVILVFDQDLKLIRKKNE